MKRVISAALACRILALVAVPASALGAPPPPLTYVACSADAAAAPSHVCHLGDTPGGFFESEVETEYEFCVTYPNAEEGCIEEEEQEPAEAEILSVDEILDADLAGDYVVSWYIEGTRVGSWRFRMEPKVVPPPPAPPVVVTPAPVVTAAPVTPAPVVAPPVAGPSRSCARAEARIARLSHELKATKVARREAAIRAQLKTARKAKGQAC